MEYPLQFAKSSFFPPSPRLKLRRRVARHFIGHLCSLGTCLACSAINSVFTIGIHVCYRSRSVHSTTAYAITRFRVREDVYSCSFAGGEVALNLFQPTSLLKILSDARRFRTSDENGLLRGIILLVTCLCVSGLAWAFNPRSCREPIRFVDVLDVIARVC